MEDAPPQMEMAAEVAATEEVWRLLLLGITSTRVKSVNLPCAAGPPCLSILPSGIQTRASPSARRSDAIVRNASTRQQGV
jgi:hypothetical protein